MNLKKQKPALDALKAEFHRRMDEISVNADGSNRSEARMLIAILETDLGPVGDNAKKLGLVFDHAAQAVSRSEFDAEWLSDIVLLALSFGCEARGSDVELAKKFLSEIGSRGGKNAQKENQSIKQEAFAWLDVNRSRFSSMDETAQAMVQAKLANIKFRTYRDWVGEWKKLRSSA